MTVAAAFIGCRRSFGQGTEVGPFRVRASPLYTEGVASLLASLSKAEVASGRKLNFLLSLDTVATDLRARSELCWS